MPATSANEVDCQRWRNEAARGAVKLFDAVVRVGMGGFSAARAVIEVRMPRFAWPSDYSYDRPAR
jgi:hypothetical protein